MSRSKKALILTVAAAAALACGVPADAAGRGNRERVRERVPLQQTGVAAFDGASILVQRQNLRNQSVLLRATGAPADALFVFMTDDAGALQQVGALRRRGDSGRATWDVRTARGDPLPFGVADVADLSGRAIEVRLGDGTPLLTGAMPAVAKATGIARRMRSLRTGLAVDDAVAGPGVSADIEFHRRDGGDTLTIELEDAAPGLTLEAWIKSADGTFEKLGDLVQAGDEGDDDQGEDDDATTGDGTDDQAAALDADEVPDGDAEYSLVLDPSTPLPFGAAALADLAGLEIEIRNAADGAVVASGFVPDVSAPDDADDDQGDDEQGDDDSTDD